MAGISGIEGPKKNYVVPPPGPVDSNFPGKKGPKEDNSSPPKKEASVERALKPSAKPDPAIDGVTAVVKTKGRHIDVIV